MNFSKAHFIGIAGKGMSATALLLRQMGVQITGSDEGFYPPVSDYLKNEKIPFAEGYRKENIPDDADVIVIGKNAKLVRLTAMKKFAPRWTAASRCDRLRICCTT